MRLNTSAEWSDGAATARNAVQRSLAAMQTAPPTSVFFTVAPTEPPTPQAPALALHRISNGDIFNFEEDDELSDGLQ